MEKTSYKKVFLLHLLLLLVLLGLVWFDVWRCPVQAILKIPCPCCGITRAYRELLQGNFRQALYYHPFFLVLPPVIWIILHKKWVFRKHPVQPWMLFTLALFGIAFISVYFLRTFIWKTPL